MSENSVWIDDLFRLRSFVEIGTRKIYLRTITGAEDSDRRRYAMLCSGNLFRKLQDKTTEEYASALGRLESLSQRDLIESICRGRERRLWQEAMTAVVQEGSPEPPKKAGPKQALEAEQARAKYAREAQERRGKYVNEHLETYRQELAAKATEDLLRMASESIIDTEVTNEFAKSIDRFTLWAASFTDEECHERLFPSVDEVTGFGMSIMDMVANKYGDMDRFTSNPEALKNLPSTPRSTD